MKNYPFSYQLTSSDQIAILCVLPLVSEIETNSEQQALRNTISSENASQKIIRHQTNFSPDELRVMFVAIDYALYLISNNAFNDELDIEPEWETEIRNHFFTLNRLYSIFENQLQPLL